MKGGVYRHVEKLFLETTYTYGTGGITATELSSQQWYPKEKKMKINFCHIAFKRRRCETQWYKKGLICPTVGCVATF